ncbi:MAG: alpha/beta hydrolase [Treponema sp.]|nr:alpha/beta hydrolase [Treponema sp.]
MKDIIVYIVHGYTSSSDAEWFPWLKSKLSRIGVNVIVLDMPNSNAPIASEWIGHLSKNVKAIDENTYFIGHSLGCITLLRFLETQHDNTKMGGIILASGFVRKIPKYPNLDQFIKSDLDIKKMTKMTPNRCVFSAPNDNYVPYEYSCELAKFLEAKLITIENGGHFIGQEGFIQFPQLFEEFRRMA